MAKKKNKYAGLTNDQIIAAAEGDVQYSPLISQIRDLYTDAARQRISDISSAKQTAQSSVAFSRAQRPTVKAVYKRGSSQADKTAADVNAAFGKLGPNNPYSAEIAAEQGGMKNRIEEARIGALQDLTNRATGAQAGKALAINQARASYRDSKSKLDQKLSDVLGQRGSFIQGRLATLGNEAASRENKIKIANIGAGATTDAATIRAKAQKDAADKKARDKAKKDAKDANKPGSSPIAKFQVKIGDAIGDLNRLANTNITIQKPDPKNTGKFIPVTKPALQFGAEGRQKIVGEMRHLRYTPQEIAIARTINRGDTLSSGDLNYLRTLGVNLKKVPRGWLSYNTLISQGRAAGPPAPGRG